MDDFGLLVGGREYGGWTALELSRAVDAMCASFSFSFVEKLGGAWPIAEGDACAVVFDGRPLLTGYVFSTHLSVQGDNEVSGRCRMADVVDSSPRLEKWTFKHSTPLAIASALCQPFGVPVALDAGLVLAPLARFSVDPGESGGTALGKLCKATGMLAMPTETGGLKLTRGGAAGRCVTALVEGVNLLGGSSRRDASERFHEIRVLAQGKAGDDANGSAAAAVQGTATDDAVRATRRLVVRPDGSYAPKEAKARAEWETATRAARGLTLSGLRVQGWTQADGSLWRENALVHVQSPRLRVDGDFLIRSVTFARSKSAGTTTVMECVSRDAFLPEPTRRPAGAARQGWQELRGGA